MLENLILSLKLSHHGFVSILIMLAYLLGLQKLHSQQEMHLNHFQNSKTQEKMSDLTASHQKILIVRISEDFDGYARFR